MGPRSKMKSQNVTTAVVLLLALLLLSWGSQPLLSQGDSAGSPSPPGKPLAATQENGGAVHQHVLIQMGHFTDDLHAALMAMKVGVALQTAGAEVTLFAHLEGIRALDSRQPLNMRWGRSKTFASYYDQFVSKGGKVLGCPHCAETAGIDEGRLRDTARIATEGEVAAMILAADKVLDY